MVRGGLVTILLMLSGCNGAPRIDLGADVARASGIDQALVFRVDSQSDSTTQTSPNLLKREQALRLALSHDPRIGTAIAHVRAAQADAQQARLLPNPILNIDVRFPEGGGTQVVEPTLSGDLIAVLSMPGHIKATDHRLRGAAADALSTVLDVIDEVLQAYTSAQSIDAEITVLEQRQNIAQQLQNQANDRLTAGEGTRLDVLTLDAQRIALDLELADKRLERTQQRLILARLIGRPRDQIDWDLEPWRAPAQVNASEPAWIDAALINRPEIQSRAWELRALGEEVKLASLEPLAGSEVGVHGERDGFWRVGPTVTFPLPIFDFGQAARAKAEALRQAAYSELNQQTIEVIEEVRGDYAAYVVSRASLDATQNQLLPIQEQQRAQAELAYRNGDADLTTLLLAENDLQQSRSNVVQLQQRLDQAMIKLERAAGGAGIAAALEQIHPATLPATTQSSSGPGTMP